MRVRTVGIVAAILLAALGVKAAEPEGLKVEVTPYAWLAGIEGDVTVKGHKADFNKSFSDLFSAVEVGGSLLGVVQYDRFLVWGQVDYFQMSTDQLDVDKQPSHGSVDSKMLLGETAVGYQIDGWMEGQTFDLLVGVRELHIENDVTVNGVGTFSRKRDIVDPIIVIRPSIPILPSMINGLRFNPTLAFGAGGDSKYVYELQPQLQYQITENIAARLGYRRVGYKFEKGGNDMDLALAGLIVGVGVTF